MSLYIVRSCTELPLSKIIHDIQDPNVVTHGNSSIGRLKITDENLWKVIFHPAAEDRNSSLSYGARILHYPFLLTMTLN